MTPELKLSFHKSFDGYLAKINIPEDVVTKSVSVGSASQPDFVLLLDRSGSMGQNVNRIITKVVPNALSKLNYDKDAIIHIITYDSQYKSEYIAMSLNHMKCSTISARGQTYLGPGLTTFSSIVPKLGEKVRILHISDGQIWDIPDAVSKATRMCQQITKGRRINSQAIRYMTGGEPDTRGLSCTLQFSNVTQSKLIDVPYVSNASGYENVANQIVEQFVNDGLSYNIVLNVPDEIIANDPWLKPSNEVSLKIGTNMIWFKDMPNIINIKGISGTVKPFLCDNINSQNVSDIIEERLNYYMDRIRVLKVVNSQDSKNEINNILTYFEQFQTYLNTTDMVQEEQYTPNLLFRFNSIKRSIEQRRKSLFMKLQQLANDDMVSQLNSAQQADYLRGVEVSKNAKGLARRALKTGFDLTDIVHKEVEAIHSHLSELDGIDDSEHSKSFYSMETTLEGLKTLGKLVDDNILKDTTPSDIIQLTNVVGIASCHQIGDYPDAMAFRTHGLYPGCYISVSDITVYQTMSKGKKLVPPGFPDKEIVNCIPIFDDTRIHQFMLKYCPTLLNLTAGVGMRRVMADVPSTHMYTVCAGLWKAIDIFATNRSEVVIETVKQLTECYNIDVGSYFDHIEKFLTDEQPGKTSYFINNNGMTNMLNLVYRQCKSGKMGHIDRIIRAIYCYEFYQMIKKFTNKAEDKLQYIETTLVDLLSLDYDKYGTKVGDPFTETPKPKHDMTVNVNQELLKSLTYNFQYFKNLYLVPVIFTALQQDDYMSAMKAIPESSDDLMMQSIKAEYSLDEFIMYSTVESIIYNSKPLRMSDKSKHTMSLPDIGFKDEAEKMLHTFITNYYQKSYNANLRQKTGQEYNTTIQEMIKQLLDCGIEEFCDIMREGFLYKGRSAQIVNTCSQGFTELGNALASIDNDVEDRFDKIWVYLIGKDEDNTIVWNGGNAVRISLNPFQECFEAFAKDELWDILNAKFKDSVKHIYRGGEEYANRHGHHNDKPSYWALGYKTVADMRNKVSYDEYLQYAHEHSECCGFNPVSLYQRKKIARKGKAASGSSHYNYY